MRKVLFISILSILLSFVSAVNMAFAQDVPEAGDWISGVVSDSMGPLAKVSVMELDTAGNVIKTVPTSIEGLFSLLLINPNDSLRFSFDGYYDVTVPVDRVRYEITLQLDRTPIPDPRSLIQYGTGAEAGHEYVDMGLSVKWATCNVGAEYPDDFGDYYAWGEISPYYESLDPLVWKEGAEKGYDNYTFNYSYDEKSKVRLYYGTPEILHVEYHKYKVDGKTQLDPENDAAHMNWGGAWRMPTDKEYKELIDSCICTFSEMNGVSGYTFKSKITGNSIFFPGAGYYNGTKFVPFEKNEGGGRKSYGGVYWSSSLSTGYSHRASCLEMVRNRWNHVEERMVETYITRNIMLRQVGTPIRPVCSVPDQVASPVFKDIERPIDYSQFKSKVVASGPRPVAGDIISGVIRDADGPMNGANVIEKDSLDRVVAYSFCDSLGKFSFRLVNPDDRLQVTYIGFYSVDCEFSGNRFEIEMKPDIDGRIIIEDWPGMPGPVIPREEDSFPLLLLNGKLASFPDGSRDRLNSFDFDRYYNDLDSLARIYGINKSDIKEVRGIKNTEAVAEWHVWGINGVLDVITQ